MLAVCSISSATASWVGFVCASSVSKTGGEPAEVNVDNEDWLEEDEFLEALTDLFVDAEVEAMSVDLVPPPRTPDLPRRMLLAWSRVSSEVDDFLRETESWGTLGSRLFCMKVIDDDGGMNCGGGIRCLSLIVADNLAGFLFWPNVF
jgi:hypothetical protein